LIRRQTDLTLEFDNNSTLSGDEDLFKVSEGCAATADDETVRFVSFQLIAKRTIKCVKMRQTLFNLYLAFVACVATLDKYVERKPGLPDGFFSNQKSQFG
jgi:hypothetical protein